MKKIKVTNPYFTVDHSFDGSVSLKFRGRYNADGTADEVLIVMNPREVLDLAASLSQNVAHALGDVLSNLAVGPCEACGNSRLIWFEDKHGNRTNRYCDCVADVTGKNEYGKKRSKTKMAVLDTIAAAMPTMADSEDMLSGEVHWEEDSDG